MCLEWSKRRIKIKFDDAGNHFLCWRRPRECADVVECAEMFYRDFAGKGHRGASGEVDQRLGSGHLRQLFPKGAEGADALVRRASVLRLYVAAQMLGIPSNQEDCGGSSAGGLLLFHQLCLLQQVQRDSFAVAERLVEYRQFAEERQGRSSIPKAFLSARKGGD